MPGPKTFCVSKKPRRRMHRLVGCLGCVSISCAINMAEPSYFAPDEATVIISDYSLGRSETLKKFHSHVLPLSGEKA